MSNSSESFRNELAARLLAALPQDQIPKVLSVLDATLSGYDVSRKQVDLIPANSIPDTVKYFIASKAVSNLSPGTLKIYRLRLVDFFTLTKKSCQDITANDIRMYLFFYKDQHASSDAYLDNIRRILSSFFRWCVDNEYLIRNPCATVERVKYQPKERIPLTPYELEELRWVCRTVREKALVDLLYSSGIRASECSAANLSDIDLESRSIVIRHGKGDKRRVVYFNAESELSLRKYLETRQDDCEALFVTIRRPHHRLGIRSIETEIRKIGRRCESHVFPHKLRHTFATSGLRGGMSLDKLQALMGHAKPETTLIYAKLDNSDLQREHSRIYA